MIDINKHYRTRDGREVRIYATDGMPPYEVHGALKSTISNDWIPYAWAPNGKHHRDHVLDLIEVRPRHKRTVFLHVFKNGSVCSTEEAYYVVTGRIACIKVELDFEEGEGL